MLRNNIIGSWNLASYTEPTQPDGPDHYPHGRHAEDIIIYTDDGYMSAQIMTADRSPTTSPPPTAAQQSSPRQPRPATSPAAAPIPSMKPPAIANTTS